MIKDWDIYCDKKITINSDYFAKLKFHLKSEMSETKFIKLENGSPLFNLTLNDLLIDNAFPLQELDGEARKYSLEIIHPFLIPVTHHQMRIHT